MKNEHCLHLRRIGAATMALGILACGTSASYAAESASGTITANTINSSKWAYSLTLTNTGTTTIGTFWLAWVPGQNYMTANPTNVLEPAGWEDGPSSVSVGTYFNGGGSSIEWQATSSGSYLQPGNTLSGFAFDSAQSPTSLFGAEAYFVNNKPTPTTTSFVYRGKPFSDGGFELVPTTIVPEPQSLALYACGGLLLILKVPRRSGHRRSVIQPSGSRRFRSA